MSKQSDALSSIFNGAAITFVGRLTGAGIGYAGTLIITNLLGPEEFGGFKYGLSFLSFVTIFSILGLTSGIGRYLRRDDGAEYFTAAVVIGTGTAAILSVVFFILSPLIAETLFEEEATPYIQAASIAILPVTLERFAIATAQAKDKALPGTLFPDLVRPITKLAGIAVVVYLGARTYGLAIVIILMMSIGCVGAWLYIWRLEVNFKRPRISVIKTLLSFSFPLILSKSVWFAMTNADTILIGYFRGQTLVGIYGAAFSTAVLLNMIINSIGSLFLPNVSELSDAGKIEEFRRVYRTATRWMLILAVPIAFGLFSFPKIILSLFGPEFPQGSTALMILAVGFLSHIIAGLNTGALKAFNRTRSIFIYQTITVICNISLNIFLIPRYGISGAALATTVSFILSNILLNSVLYREAKMAPVELQTLVSAISALGIGVLVARNSNIGSVEAAVAISCLFAIVWGSSCVLSGLVEIDQIKSFRSN